LFDIDAEVFAVDWAVEQSAEQVQGDPQPKGPEAPEISIAAPNHCEGELSLMKFGRLWALPIFVSLYRPSSMNGRATHEPPPSLIPRYPRCKPISRTRH
jgi:hypothetical protein